MRCRICGASCRCKNAANGICCSCHPHRKGVSPAAAAAHKIEWEKQRELDIEQEQLLQEQSS